MPLNYQSLEYQNMMASMRITSVSVLILFLIVSTSTSILGQSDANLIESTLRFNKIKQHTYFLASDELKGRKIPSDELDIAAQYLVTTLMGLGVKHVPTLDGYLQKLELQYASPPLAAELIVQKDSILSKQDMVLIAGGDIDVTSSGVFIEYGEESDFIKANVRGKIVITMPGDSQSEHPQEWFYATKKKRLLAQKHGAKALLELYSSPMVPWNVLNSILNVKRLEVIDPEEVDTLTHFWLNVGGDGSRITQRLLEANKTINVVSSPRLLSKHQSSNVVGLIEGRDSILKNQYVIYSAHYDHVGIGRAAENGDTIYNGARDNAVGCTAVLSAAENISRFPLKRSALIIFFTGEEKGLLGSKWYASHPIVPLEKTVFCLNADNSGYNDTSLVTVIGKTKTNVASLFDEACSEYDLIAHQDSILDKNFYKRSDNLPFAQLGIPAVTFSMGFAGFDDVISSTYHRPADGPESLDYRYIQKYVSSYVHSGRLIGEMSKIPFWVNDDDYFKIGENLYGSSQKDKEDESVNNLQLKQMIKQRD